MESMGTVCIQCCVWGGGGGVERAVTCGCNTSIHVLVDFDTTQSCKPRILQTCNHTHSNSFTTTHTPIVHKWWWVPYTPVGMDSRASGGNVSSSTHTTSTGVCTCCCCTVPGVDVAAAAAADDDDDEEEGGNGGCDGYDARACRMGCAHRKSKP